MVREMREVLTSGPTADDYRAALARLDLERSWGGRPIGLRDGAVLALLASNLRQAEIPGLPTSAVRQRQRGGAVVEVDGRFVVLRDLESSVLLDYRSWRRQEAAGLWLFTNPKADGPITETAVQKIARRHLLQHKRRTARAQRNGSEPDAEGAPPSRQALEPLRSRTGTGRAR